MLRGRDQDQVSGTRSDEFHGAQIGMAARAKDGTRKSETRQRQRSCEVSRRADSFDIGQRNIFKAQSPQDGKTVTINVIISFKKGVSPVPKEGNGGKGKQTCQ